MKRVHFNYLWNNCAPSGVGYILDPELLGIEESDYQPWFEHGVLGNPFELKVKTRDGNINGLAEVIPTRDTGLIVKDWKDHMFDIFSNEPESFWERHIRYKDYIEIPVKVYQIQRDRLAELVADDWGIVPLFWEIPPCGYLFGYRDSEHHVIVLSGKIDRLLLPTVAIDTRENLGLKREMKASKKTYVVTSGSTVLTYPELQRLFEHNIVFAGTQDFLTEEGEAVWEFEYMKEVETETHPIDLFLRDPVTGRLMYDGAIIHLTPTEDIIFWQFRKRFGMAVNKDELRDIVWRGRGKKEPGYPEENLRNHIFGLRNELEEHTPFTIELTGLGNYRMTVRKLQDKDVKM